MFVEDSDEPFDFLRDRSRWVKLRMVASGNGERAEFDLPWPPGAPMFVPRRFEWLHEHGWELGIGGRSV